MICLAMSIADVAVETRSAINLLRRASSLFVTRFAFSAHVANLFVSTAVLPTDQPGGREA